MTLSHLKQDPKLPKEIRTCFDFWDKPLAHYLTAVAEGKPQAGSDLNIRLWWLSSEDKICIQRWLDKLTPLEEKIQNASEAHLANKLYLLSILHYLKNGKSDQAAEFAQQARNRGCSYLYIQTQKNHTGHIRSYKMPFLKLTKITAASANPYDYPIDSEILFFKGVLASLANNRTQALTFYCLTTFNFNKHPLAYSQIANILNDPNHSEPRLKYLTHWQQWHPCEIDDIYQNLANKEKSAPRLETHQVPQQLEQVDWKLLAQAYRLASLSRGNFFEIYELHSQLEHFFSSPDEHQKATVRILEAAARLGDYRCAEELCYNQLKDPQLKLTLAQLGAENGSNRLLFELTNTYSRAGKLFNAFIWLQKARKKEKALDWLAKLMAQAYDTCDFNVFALCCREMRQIIAYHLPVEFSLESLFSQLFTFYNSKQKTFSLMFNYHLCLLFTAIPNDRLPQSSSYHKECLQRTLRHQCTIITRRAVLAQPEQQRIKDPESKLNNNQDFFDFCTDDKLSDVQAAFDPELYKRVFHAYAHIKASQKKLNDPLQSSHSSQKVLGYVPGQRKLPHPQEAAIKALIPIYQCLIEKDPDPSQLLPSLEGLHAEDALVIINFFTTHTGSRPHKAWELAQHFPRFAQDPQQNRELNAAINQYNTRIGALKAPKPADQALAPEEKKTYESKYSIEAHQDNSRLRNNINPLNVDQTTIRAKIQALTFIYQALLPQENDAQLQKLREFEDQPSQALAYIQNQLSASKLTNKLGKAWILAERYYQYATSGLQYQNLFREIYLYNFEHSGIFCRSQISGRTFFSFNRISLAKYLSQHGEVFSRKNIQAQLQSPEKYDRTRKIYDALEGRPIAESKKISNFFALFKLINPRTKADSAKKQQPAILSLPPKRESTV